MPKAKKVRKGVFRLKDGVRSAKRDVSVKQVKPSGAKSRLSKSAKALAEKRMKKKRARERRAKALSLKRKV